MYTRGQWADVSCIPESGCYSFSFLYFFIFLSLQFSNIKNFVTLFSGTVRPRKLKLCTQVNSGQMYRVYWNQAAAAETLKFFVTLFSGTVRPRSLKLGIQVDSEQVYRVYRNQAAATYAFLYFFIFFISNFQTLHSFVILFSGTVSPRRFKLGTHVDSRQIYHVYWNQAAAAYWSLYFSFFFLSNFQTLKVFLTLFSGTVRPRRLKLYTHVDNGRMYPVYRNHAAVLIGPFISSLFFLSNFHTLQFFVTCF